LPVVVKPREGSQGRGVSIGLNSREAVESAYSLAEEVGGGVLVERYVPGSEHRLLVVNGRVIAAARGDEARIKGDGTHTVADLVETQLNSDPRRGDAAACPLSLIEFDSIVLITLSQQGLSPESIPAAGASVLVRRNGNLAVDVTDEVHPEVAARAVEAAAVVGLDVCGLDVVAVDIGRPLEEQGGVVVDVNEGPGLQMHMQPAIGKPRPVAEAILATLIPPGESGRIPIIGVAGGSEAAVAAKVIARSLAKACGPVGLTSADGVFVNNRRIHAGDSRDPASAELLLMNPVIEAAVFEQAQSGRLIEGLGFDLCDVAVVTGLAQSNDDSSTGRVPRVDQARLARTLVETVSPSGAAVLDATDPLAAALAPFCAGEVIYFAAGGDDPILAQHLVRGGRGVFQRGDQWVLAEGELEVEYGYSSLAPFIEFERGTFSVSAALAALAVCWSLGMHVAPRLEGHENGAASRRAVG
jgi:cyanophycin synthetase